MSELLHNGHPSTESSTPEAPPALPPARGPFGPLLDLFSSIWLGVTLLTLLFVYSAIGSAGAPIGPGILKPPFLLRPDAWVSVRELIEISEFEWFHLWPFDLLIALICVNLVVATLRRIPFNVVNLGVWMIHTGIIVLCVGSVWYFSTKVEGDAPVVRRQVVATVPGFEPVSFLAVPGNRAQVGGGAETYVLQVMGITPEWELLSGDDEGTRAYKVSVQVQSAAGDMFVRELIAGFPQYTEDLVRSDDPRQPFARAKKTLGTPLVNDTLDLDLAFAEQTHFYLRESAALYVREVGATAWAERPIERLPRFRDHISGYEQVWPAGGDALPPLRPLDIVVPPAADDDPLGVPVRITDYLAYAALRTERLPGGDRLAPAATIRLRDETGRTQDFQVVAFDPQRSSLGGGAVTFQWATSEEHVQSLREVRPPRVQVAVADAGVEREHVIEETVTANPDLAFTELPGTEYAYRVRSFQDDLNIEGRTVSLAIVEIRRGDERFVRWVFDDPRLTRDLPDDADPAAHQSPMPGAVPLDEAITMTYRPGQRAGIRLVAGPGEEQLRLLLPTEMGTGPLVEHAVTIGMPITVQAGISLAVTRYAARSRSETRPQIEALHRRNRDVGNRMSMIRVHVPTSAGIESRWLPFHVYAFAGPTEVIPRFRYEPTVVHLPDGRHVEMIFSRRRLPLPAPVVLEDFELTTHIGGYAGSNTSVRDWTSIVRFAAADGFTPAEPVSVNAPAEHDGYWFFQSQWDPPSEGSAGLNYTVLGVGNRNGVLTQLLGCCLAVIGMIYAFYVKPVIKRRRRAAVYARVAPSAARPPVETEAAVVTAGEESS